MHMNTFLIMLSAVKLPLFIHLQSSWI